MGAAEKLELRNEKGGIDYDRILKLMAIPKMDLATMLDYERTSLLSSKVPTPKMLAALAPYFRILAILWDHFEGNSEKIAQWLHDPKRDWLYLSPIEMMKRGKTEQVVEYLVAQLDPRTDIFNG